LATRASGAWRASAAAAAAYARRTAPLGSPRAAPTSACAAARATLALARPGVAGGRRSARLAAASLRQIED